MVFNIHIIALWCGDAHGVRGIVVGSSLSYPSSNPERDCLHFT